MRFMAMGIKIVIPGLSITGLRHFGIGTKIKLTFTIYYRYFPKANIRDYGITELELKLT